MTANGSGERGRSENSSLRSEDRRGTSTDGWLHVLPTLVRSDRCCDDVEVLSGILQPVQPLICLREAKLQNGGDKQAETKIR